MSEFEPLEPNLGDPAARAPASVRRGVFTNLAADLTVAVSSLVMSILLSRILGPENRGLYFLTIFGATVASYVADVGMAVVAVAFAARRRLLPQIHTTAVAVALAAGALAVVIFLGAHDFWSETVFDGLDLGLLTVLALGVTPMVYMHISGATLAGLGEVPALSAIRIGGAVLSPIVTVPAAVLSDGDPVWTASMWLLVTILVAVAFMAVLVLRGVAFALPSRAELRTILGFGLRGYVGNLSHFGFLRLDIVFVSTRLGSAAVGIYSLASLLAERVWLLGSALYMASAQRIGAAHPDDGAAYTARLVRLLLVVLLPPVVILGATASFWLPLIYGEDFDGAVVPFVLLLPGAVFLAVWYVVSLYVTSGARRPGLTAWAQLAAFGLSVPLYYFGVRAWGMNGAAAVSSIVYGAVLVFGLAIYSRLTGVRLRWFLPGRRDVGEIWAIVGEVWRARRRPAHAADAEH